MKFYALIEAPDKEFVLFESGGYTWMIHTKTLRVYHYESGVLLNSKKVIRGKNWRTVRKKFSLMFDKISPKRLQQFKRMIRDVGDYNGPNA